MPSFPTWLKKRDDGAFVVDPDIAYPNVFGVMGVNEADLTQYHVECAYQCAKLAVQDLITGTDQDPRPEMGFIIIIDSSAGRKDRWALAGFAPGKPGADMNAATKGQKAKQLYYAGVGASLRA